MIQLAIGAVAMAVLFLPVGYTRRRGLAVRWWQWVLTVLGIL